jgi:hypothetical protein
VEVLAGEHCNVFHNRFLIDDPMRNNGSYRCLLSAVCYLLSAVCWLLSAVCCLLSAVYGLLPAACCLLPAACCVLSSRPKNMSRHDFIIV